MAANAFAQRGSTKGGLFEKEWFRHLDARQEVLRKTESLWSDRSRPPRKPKALPPARAWAPGDARTPVIIVTGPLGGGKSSVVGHLAARDALVVTHRYWQDWGTTPPPPHDDGIDRASVFDFGNACVCCAPDGDLQALLTKKSARSVLIETTGTADPALFARVLHQDAILRELYVLRSVVFVADARDVRKQLAAPDSPGAPNPHRLQLLAANHAVLTRGDDDITLPGFAGTVDHGLPGRGALGGFDATAVVERRMDFLGVDPTRPCRFVRPVVSFAPSDGVLRAVAVVEQGAARDADVLAFAEELAASSAVARFRVAADGAATGVLLIDGGRAGDALRIVRRDGGVEPDDDASTASSEASEVVDAGDWRREAAPQLRLFVLGTKLDAASLREGLRACLVPEGFRYAADEELDFGVCSDDDPLSRCLAGAPAEAKDRIYTNVDGESIEIARAGPRRYTATDAAGASLEVVRLFESALYVK
ncbi:unnamed protein product [Pelagomonas calceolata]|uniref:CobW/HypB/UreG nucleotide-binding domain-containing protein n=1 Tax=Pelagomonas calceolata TaxID=35677 RepID=A0A8J2WXH7_9STRA|nr:unnamed protein product [Pelagomonas calceolata]